MTTRITIANLLGAGFSLTGSMPRNASPEEKQTMLAVFSKGIMSIHLTYRSATAYKLGTELGPVSTMEQVQALDSVINTVPPEAITAERLTALDWGRDSSGAFWNLGFGIELCDNPCCASRLFTTAGLATLHLGYVSTMSEVEALTAIAKRGITKD